MHANDERTNERREQKAQNVQSRKQQVARAKECESYDTIEKEEDEVKRRVEGEINERAAVEKKKTMRNTASCCFIHTRKEYESQEIVGRVKVNW